MCRKPVAGMIELIEVFRCIPGKLSYIHLSSGKYLTKRAPIDAPALGAAFLKFRGLEISVNPCRHRSEVHAFNLATQFCHDVTPARSEEHTFELQSLMRTSYAVFCLTKKTHN